MDQLVVEGRRLWKTRLAKGEPVQNRFYNKKKKKNNEKVDLS